MTHSQRFPHHEKSGHDPDADQTQGVEHQVDGAHPPFGRPVGLSGRVAVTQHHPNHQEHEQQTAEGYERAHQHGADDPAPPIEVDDGVKGAGDLSRVFHETGTTPAGQHEVRGQRVHDAEYRVEPGVDHGYPQQGAQPTDAVGLVGGRPALAGLVLDRGLLLPAFRRDVERDRVGGIFGARKIGAPTPGRHQGGGGRAAVGRLVARVEVLVAGEDQRHPVPWRVVAEHLPQERHELIPSVECRFIVVGHPFQPHGLGHTEDDVGLATLHSRPGFGEIVVLASGDSSAAGQADVDPPDPPVFRHPPGEVASGLGSLEGVAVRIVGSRFGDGEGIEEGREPVVPVVVAGDGQDLGGLVHAVEGEVVGAEGPIPVLLSVGHRVDLVAAEDEQTGRLGQGVLPPAGEDGGVGNGGGHRVGRAEPVANIGHIVEHRIGGWIVVVLRRCFPEQIDSISVVGELGEKSTEELAERSGGDFSRGQPPHRLL